MGISPVVNAVGTVMMLLSVSLAFVAARIMLGSRSAARRKVDGTGRPEDDSAYDSV
jgi:ABC-type spermidine/putrescine transport system permease subunit II